MDLLLKNENIRGNTFTPAAEMSLYHKRDHNDSDDYYYDGCVRCGETFDDPHWRISGVERYKRTEVCEDCAERSKMANRKPKGPGGRCEDPDHQCQGGCGRWFCQTKKELDRTYIPLDKISSREVRYKRSPKQYHNTCDDCWNEYKRHPFFVLGYLMIALECTYSVAQAVARVS